MIIGHDKRRSRATLGRDGIALTLGNTIESTLLEVWVVSPEQTSKLSPLFNYLEVAWVEESYPPPRHYPPMPENGERDGPVVLRVVELTLTPTSCNTWERRPCTSPGQYNTVKPVIRGMREPTLKL